MNHQSRLPVTARHHARPSSSNRQQALKAFHQRVADRRRGEAAQRADGLATPDVDAALKGDMARPRKVIRQHGLHGKVTRMAAHKGQDGGAFKAYDRARLAIGEDLNRMQHALSTRVLPGRAAATYCNHTVLASPLQPGPEATARQAYELLGSISGALNSVSASRNPKLNRFSDSQRHARHPSASERLFDAIDSAIPMAKVQCAAGAEIAALNGACAANLLVNLVQGPTRIALISGNILDLALQVEALAPPDTPASAQHLKQKSGKEQKNEKVATLKAMVGEAQGLHVALQVKVMAMAKVADQAIGVLVKDAQTRKLKPTDRDEIQKAVRICTAFKLALDNLNRAYADPGWVYAQLDQLTQSVGQAVAAGTSHPVAA